MSWARDLFGPELANQSGKISVEQALAKKRVIGVYFSAHWVIRSSLDSEFSNFIFFITSLYSVHHVDNLLRCYLNSINNL